MNYRNHYPKFLAAYLIILVVLYIKFEVMAPHMSYIYMAMFLFPPILLLNSNMASPMQRIEGLFFIITLYLEAFSHLALLLCALSILKQKTWDQKSNKIVIACWLILISKMFILAPIVYKMVALRPSNIFMLGNIFLNPILPYGLPIYLLTSQRTRKYFTTEIKSP